MPIRAITFDLDDTLWAIDPVIARAEEVLHAWFETHWPELARRYPPPALRALRDALAQTRPDLHHDLTALRRLSLEHAARDCGYDAGLAQAAFDVLWRARNEVELYPDVLPALEVLASRYALAGLTNGNADVTLCGVGHALDFCVTAREIGVPKPHPRIFAAAVRRLGVAAHEVLHVGDDPARDIEGARAAGLRTAWVNRAGAPWLGGQGADVEVPDLLALVAWLHTRAGGA
jgi:FMN hydrolase / 5-amino-6-(5-phospho-D-ribitylamino)uracil phosphatase